MLIATALAAVFCLLSLTQQRSLISPATAAQQNSKKLRDPAAWGGDHVGKTLPEYMTGSECLFCHREKVGPAWQTNRHRLTVRLPEDEPAAMAALEQDEQTKQFAADVDFVMGGRNRVRYLRRSKAYGKADLLSVACAVEGAEHALEGAATGRWDTTKFADSCAGCHATAVDSELRAFAAVGHDCYSCHGDVDVDHSEDPKLVHLAKARKDSAAVVISICAQCHIRTGKSKSTGLPYPNQFVAGDNLFRDFQADFSDEHLQRLNPGDRHVLENVRDVILQGQTRVTCLSCHDVHGQSNQKHRRVSRSRHLCVTCHFPTGPKSKLKEYEVKSELCEY